MKPRLHVEILTLKPQVLLDLVHRQLLDQPPRCVLGLPDDVPFGVGHLQWGADLVGVVVINLIFILAFALINTRERRIAAGFVEVQAALLGAFCADIKDQSTPKLLSSDAFSFLGESGHI
ncbi:hypothetical protein ALO98_200433 [Pseudomonas syringae pv. tagetis]|nr:hypothetical protein ALO98_200433 [Pseudomonas syringae pv. tagetis]